MPSKGKTKWYDRPIGSYGIFSHDGTKPKTNYMLTAKGKVKAEEVSVSGPKGEVIMALDSSEGPSTMSEIVSATRMSPQTVKQVIRALIREGWVTKVSVE